jgi:hypothetical protein
MFYRLRGLIAELLEALLEAFFGGQPREQREQLACEIVDYGRMNTEIPDTILIEVPEVAFRLRESPRHIRQSLRLLELKGIAYKTHSKDHWRLSA